MNRTRKMIKDILLFAVASFGPKLLSFFLVPLYTSYLTTDAYGTSDILLTVVSLILPICMLDISDAVMIFTVDAKQQNGVIDAPLRFSDIILRRSSLGILGVLVIVASIFRTKEMAIYCAFILINYYCNALFLNIQAYLRGVDRSRVIVIGSLIHSCVSMLCNILFIAVLRMGLYGILLANIAGYVAGDCYLCCKIGYSQLLQKTQAPSPEDRKKMLSYSIPLIFSGLAWWVNNSSDRLFITMLAGVGANGIYAVANKVPTILSACSSVIYQALQINVFSQQKAADKESYQRCLYAIYTYGMVIVCSVLILCNKLLARFLFKGEFFVAWEYVPGLLICAVLYAAIGYMSIVTSAEKQSMLITKSTVAGAFVNTLLNLLLIGRFQLFGAVIATIIGYFVNWLILIIMIQKCLGLKLPMMRSIVCYSLLTVQWGMDLGGSSAIFIAAQFGIFIMLNLINKDSILDIWQLGLQLFRTIFAKFKKTR